MPNHWTPARVRKLRDKLILSQTDFGARLSEPATHYMTVSQWERGVKKPSFTNQRRLNELLAVS